jgi:hypothetical protein
MKSPSLGQPVVIDNVGGSDEGKRHQHGLRGVTRRPLAADRIADLY